MTCPCASSRPPSPSPASRSPGPYRLATTLLDHRQHPAATHIRLYHERWEIESAFYALRHTILDGHVLRSTDPPGLHQELWALLTVYQILRMAIVDAIETQPGTDPDRAGFTIALEPARNQITNAADILPDPTDPLGVIGAGLLPDPMPARRDRRVGSGGLPAVGGRRSSG